MPNAHPGIWPAKAHPSCDGQRLKPPNAPPDPDHPTTATTHQVAARKDGKRPTLAVERKILRRCYHTLRELGDTALAVPTTKAKNIAA